MQSGGPEAGGHPPPSASPPCPPSPCWEGSWAPPHSASTRLHLWNYVPSDYMTYFKKINKWLRRDLRILILSPKRHHCQRALVLEVGFCVLFCFFPDLILKPNQLFITFVVLAKFLNLVSLSFSVKVINITEASLCGPGAI